jgi:threonylcarbamoyladenosine tRNA methylthiotransferase MtaB
LHIPIQSGDDEILKKMKRKYSRKFYLELIDKIKKKVPGVSITTDCLVGFPGESEKCFQNTLRLVKQIVPLKTHIFPYSSRKGTNAFRFAGENDKALIERWCSELKEAAEECGLSYRKLFLCKTADVLIEGKVKKDPGFWQGYTSSYIRVLVKSKCNLKNRIIPLRLEKLKDDFIVGSKSIA